MIVRILLVVSAAIGAASLAAQSPARKLPPAADAVELRVVDGNGGPIQELRITLRAWVGDRKRYRVLPGEVARTLTTKDFVTDHARIGGLPAGDHVWMVEAPGHAVVYSERFRIPADEPVRLQVRLARGAVLTGTVLDPDGKPVAGATVRTVARAGDDNRHPFAQALLGMVVEPITYTSVQTAADGTFRIEHAAKGDYRLLAEHFAFAGGSAVAEVGGSGVVKVAPIALAAGCQLRGAVLRSARPVPGAVVVLQSPPDPRGKGLAHVAIYHEVIADGDGRFQLPRVPAGEYQLAGREAGDPLATANQLNASRRTVQLQVSATGAAQIVDIVLPKQ